ncbi:MAG: hypothetical protein ACOZF0_17440 [Thermodesulfobacteriota bacterium]
MSFSKQCHKKRKQIDPLEQAIEKALLPGSFISYQAAGSFVDNVQAVANNLEKTINKEPERAARLFETFIAACHEKADEIDDSGGDFGMLVEDLFRDWIKARQAAKLNPDETAALLLSWMEDDSYGYGTGKSQPLPDRTVGTQAGTFSSGYFRQGVPCSLYANHPCRQEQVLRHGPRQPGAYQEMLCQSRAPCRLAGRGCRRARETLSQKRIHGRV